MKTTIAEINSHEFLELSDYQLASWPPCATEAPGQASQMKRDMHEIRRSIWRKLRAHLRADNPFTLA